MSETLDVYLCLIAALTFKHFLADFVLQRDYQFRNKGHYGHPGGVLHASIHAVGTLVSFVWFAPIECAVMLAGIDLVVHYHLDYAKARVNKHMKLNPNEGAQYWMLFGFDQFLHHMTYVGLLVIAAQCSYIG